MMTIYSSEVDYVGPIKSQLQTSKCLQLKCKLSNFNGFMLLHSFTLLPDCMAA